MKLLAAVAFLLLAPAAALADVNAGTETVGTGSVSATLSWNAGADGPQDMKLTIVRDGVTAYDRPVPQLCGDECDEAPDDPEEFTAADLDGDGDPEIVFNGLDGSDCCGIYVFYSDGGGYREFRHRFSEFPTVDDLDNDGRSEVLARDSRFTSLFDDGGGSFLPLAIFAYSRPGGGAPELTDATRRFRRELLDDAAIDRDYAGFVDGVLEAGEARGAAGSYVADEFLLGRGQAGLRFFAKQARRGILGPPRTVRRFRRELLVRLHRYGYR